MNSSSSTSPPAAAPDGLVELSGSICPSCGVKSFPSAYFCAACMSEVKAAVFPGRGSLYSFTEVHVGPAARRPPYVIGYLDLDDGVRVLARGVDPVRSLAMGCRVRLIPGPILWDDSGPVAEGHVFTTEGAG